MKLFIYCCLLLWSLLPQASFAEPWQQERMVYQQGLQAIQNGDMSHYAASRRLLKDYPLLAYFEYHYLSTRFAELPDKAIAQFLQRHQGTFIAQRLSSAWLDRKSTRLNSSHVRISYAVFCLKKKNKNKKQ